MHCQCSKALSGYEAGIFMKYIQIEVKVVTCEVALPIF